jgi:hypothetical protein
MRVNKVAALPASAATNAQPPGRSTALLRSAVKSTSASGSVDRGYVMSEGQFIGPCAGCSNGSRQWTDRVQR